MIERKDQICSYSQRIRQREKQQTPNLTHEYVYNQNPAQVHEMISALTEAFHRYEPWKIAVAQHVIEHGGPPEAESTACETCRRLDQSLSARPQYLEFSLSDLTHTTMTSGCRNEDKCLPCRQHSMNVPHLRNEAARIAVPYRRISGINIPSAHEQAQDPSIANANIPGYHVIPPAPLVPGFSTSSPTVEGVVSRTGSRKRSSVIDVDLSSSLADMAFGPASLARVAAGAVAAIAFDGSISVARGALHYYSAAITAKFRI